MVTDLSHHLLPLFDERSLPSVRVVLGQNEFSVFAPHSQLVDGLSNRYFTQGFVAEFLDFLCLLDHDWSRVNEVFELQVVLGYIFCKFQYSKQPFPVLFLERFTSAQLE